MTPCSPSWCSTAAQASEQRTVLLLWIVRPLFWLLKLLSNMHSIDLLQASFRHAPWISLS